MGTGESSRSMPKIWTVNDSFDICCSNTQLHFQADELPTVGICKPSPSCPDGSKFRTVVALMHKFPKLEDLRGEEFTVKPDHTQKKHCFSLTTKIVETPPTTLEALKPLSISCLRGRQVSIWTVLNLGVNSSKLKKRTNTTLKMLRYAAQWSNLCDDRYNDQWYWYLIHARGLSSFLDFVLGEKEKKNRGIFRQSPTPYVGAYLGTTYLSDVLYMHVKVG